LSKATPPLAPISVRHYGEHGSYLVLLHGGPGAPGEMAPVARCLSDRFRVLEPLQRRSGVVPLTVARHVADLHEVLRGPLREGPVRLVGFSWGAMLALTYAARYPVEVERLILIGCGTFDRRGRDVYQARIAERIRPDETQRIRDIEAQLSTETDRRRRNELFAALGVIYERIQSCELLASESAEELPCDEANFRQTWADAVSLQEQGVQPAEFARIEGSVAMIHGCQDPHPGRLIRESLTPFIRGIQYHELLRCGHKPWIEREAKDKFYELLSRCLG